MSHTNGFTSEDPATPPSPGRRTKTPAERHPILSLVSEDFLKSTANTSQGMWEPMAYLYSEAAKSMDRVEGMDIPANQAELDAQVAAMEVRELSGAKLIEVTPKRTALQWALRRRPTPEFKADPAAVLRVTTRKLNPGEQARAKKFLLDVMQTKEATIKQWGQVIGWLDELLVQSGSVGALRSWQLMTGLQNPGGAQPKPSAAVMPDFPQPQPPKGQGAKPNRGLRL